MIEKEDAKKLIELAKRSVSDIFTGEVTEADDELKEKFSEPEGIFVTLTKKGELRGCMGQVEAAYPLYEGVMKLAKAAAFEDPRFPQMEEGELNDVKFEISILTPKKRIKVKDASEYPKKIEIGRDGLMIKGNLGSGLLLPQVAVEQGWDAEEFLRYLCEKAGLDPDDWKDLDNEIYAFQAEIWSEENGDVVKK